MLMFPKPTPHQLVRRRKRLDLVAQLKASQAFVRERDAGWCRCCGRPGTEVHHIRYRSRGGGHDPENLVLLCAGCHAAVHGHTLDLRRLRGRVVFAWMLA